jgi:hypothetical protein
VTSVFVVVACDFYGDSSVVGVFASREDATRTIQKLRVAQEADEARAWSENPCECGDRNCDYHTEQFSFHWHVEEWDVQPKALV